MRSTCNSNIDRWEQVGSEGANGRREGQECHISHHPGTLQPNHIIHSLFEWLLWYLVVVEVLVQGGEEKAVFIICNPTISIKSIYLWKIKQNLGQIINPANGSFQASIHLSMFYCQLMDFKYLKSNFNKTWWFIRFFLLDFAFFFHNPINKWF